MNVIEGNFRATGKKFAIVVSRFNHFVVDSLLEGAVDALERHGEVNQDDITIVYVPGAYELPLAAKKIAKRGEVDAIIAIFNSKEEFRLGLSPEGTRKKVNTWKTGFYYIAKGANVPIVMATLDFENKKIKISEPYYTTSDKEKDFAFLRGFYLNVKGKNPELS